MSGRAKRGKRKKRKREGERGRKRVDPKIWKGGGGRGRHIGWKNSVVDDEGGREGGEDGGDRSRSSGGRRGEEGGRRGVVQDFSME